MTANLLNRVTLRAAIPGIDTKAAELSLGALISACREYEINTPVRLAAFLGQLAYESQDFRFMTEIWGPTQQQLRYEPPSSLAQSLGNTQPGDGYRYRGRGPIQITGRANYRRFGEMLKLPLEEHPERASWYGIGCRIAAAFWFKRNLSMLADADDIESIRLITRRINGGTTHLARRLSKTNVARVAFGLSPLVSEEQQKVS